MSRHQIYHPRLNMKQVRTTPGPGRHLGSPSCFSRIAQGCQSGIMQIPIGDMLYYHNIIKHFVCTIYLGPAINPCLATGLYALLLFDSSLYVNDGSTMNWRFRYHVTG